MNNNIAIAEAFYTTMSKKNIAGLATYLHSDMQFITPLATVVGKQVYLEAAKGFAAFFKTLTIRAVCGSEDHATVVYDIEFPAPIGNVPSAALMTIKDGLITKIELFYDARPFEKK